jgi:5'-nucleotidase
MSKLNILLANDDGIDAPGIKVLEEGLSAIANIYVVAPSEERSITSHTLTLRSGMQCEQRDERHVSCGGFPADCIRLGVNYFFSDIKFDWVISGINRGSNMGQDVYYSGTVAAAREGCFDGIKSIAISTVLDDFSDQEVYYSSAVKVLLDIFKNPQQLSVAPPFELLNINVPNLEYSQIRGIKETKLGWQQYSKRAEKRGELYHIVGEYLHGSLEMGSDTHAVREGYASLSRLRLL